MGWLRRGGGTASGGAGPVARSGVFKTDGCVTGVGGPAPVPVGAGAPALQRLTGDGSGILDLTTGAGSVVLGITHHGSGHFVVEALDERMRSGSQLVYTDGPFACRALANADDRPVRALRIEADGPWAVEVTGLDDAVVLDGHAERPASDVLRYEGGPAVAHLRHTGAPRSSDGGYFLADTYEPDSSGFLDELANHVGPWAGEVPLSGPCLVYARSEGPWSISIRPWAAERRGSVERCTNRFERWCGLDVRNGMP